MESKPIVKKILRSPNLKRKSKTIPITQRVTLEKVLGLTVSKNAGLACDPNTGTIAYPAGCVIVLFNPRKNKQTHIFNSSKKTLTTVAFSGDGRHLVSGESGHQPAVRVWDVEERTQVAQFLGHKFGINCVVFSPNLKYIVSVGSQHDMMVNVWNWKTNSKVKSNKVSSKVNAVAFSEDGSYFVTVGNRHVKFWYLENQKSKVNETVPLLGRNGILEDQKNNFFCDVVCGRGSTAGSTFCITQSGLLCELDSKRYLSKWVELRTTSANCISVGDEHIFIGCSDGVVRVFSCHSLHFVTTLPKPHALGVDISAATSPSHMVSNKENAKFPDTIALVTDVTNKKITCVYNDHSLYIWDVRNLNKVGKAWSFLFHSSCIWSIETYPRLGEGQTPLLPPGSFLTCSSDDTIRVWNLDPHMTENTSYKHNIYSHEVLKILYVDPTFANLCDVNYNPAGTKDKTDTNYDGKNGVRAIKVSPDGQHLASGDRLGNIRIHDLQFMEEISIVEAHDGEVLSLEYSNFPSGPRLLASTSRDRLVHVFDVEQDYGLIQTLDDHSSSISAVKFTETDHTLKMLSCGADKSLLFRNAVLSPSFQFSLSHHLVGKTTLYDMDIDPTHKFVATACQDRNIRIYNIKTAKQKKCYKGSIGDDGVVTKVHLDPSGSFAATSSTDKNLCILDFYTGEFLASMFGHSEIATGVKFTNDLKHLITTGAEGCIFVWRLSSDFTKQMRSRLEELGRMPKELSTTTENEIKRGSFIMPKPIVFDQTDSSELFPVFKESDFKSPEKVLDALGRIDEIPSRDVRPGPNAPIPGADYRFSVGSLPRWAKPMSAEQSSKNGESSAVGGPRGKWAERVDSQAITVKSMLDGEKTIELAKEATSDRRFTYEADALRRETMVISNPETPPVNLPIITADDENNLEDDDDFLPLSFGPRNLDRSGDFDRSINISRGSDPPGLNHKWTSRRSLLVDGDDADDEETDSETREVIYYPQGEADPSDANFSSYKVFAISCDELKEGRNKLRRSTAGSEGSVRDADSESTDPLSLDDVEEESDDVPSLPTTPLEPERDFTPTKSRFIHDNIENFTPIDQDKFSRNLDNIERQLFDEDSRRIFSPRLSISAKFLNRAGGARNVARQDTWFDSVQKRKDDMARAVDETRRKLESLGWGGDRADDTHLDHPPERGAKLSLAPDTYYSLPRLKKTQFNAESSNQSNMSEARRVTPSSPVRSISLGKADAGEKSCGYRRRKAGTSIRRSWSSADLLKPIKEAISSNYKDSSLKDSAKYGKPPLPKGRNSRIPFLRNLPNGCKTKATGALPNKPRVSTFELRPKSISEEPTKPPKPSSLARTAQDRTESSSFMSRKGTSERNIPSEVAAESEKTRLYTRRHSNEQHSYLRPTKSSRAKIARAASSSNLNRDRTSSTDNLSRSANSSSMENLNFQDSDAPVANFDNFRHSLSRQKTVSVPNLATCFEEEEEEETSNLCNLIDLSKSVPDFMDADETSSSYSDSSSLAVSEPAVIALNRSAHSSRAMRDSSRKVNQWNTRRSLPGDLAGSKPSWAKPPRSREDFDRFIMPPPSKTQVARTSLFRKTGQAKRRSAPDLTLEQAKNILLGNSGILGKSSLSEYRPSKSNSSRSKPKDIIPEYPESGTVSNLKQQFSNSKSNLSSQKMPGNSSLITNSSKSSTFNTSDHKGASGDRVTSRVELDASPIEPPVRDQPSKPSSQTSGNGVKGPDANLSSPPTKDSPSSQMELVNGGVSSGSKLSSARIPALGKSSSSGNVPQSQSVKVNSPASKLRPIDLDVHRRPEKDIGNISDIATDLSPNSLSSGDTASVGTASSTSPRDLNFPKQSTPVNGGASLPMSQSFSDQQGKPATPVTKASGVSPAPTGGILRKAMMFGQTREVNSNSNLKQLRGLSMDKIIDDSCSEFDEISSLTVTPSKLRSSQGGVVLPWQVNGRTQQAQSDSGVSSDTDESEPKRPPRRLPVSTMVNNRAGNQVSTLKPELSTKPKMSLPSVPSGPSQVPNGQSTTQRRGSAPSSTHVVANLSVQPTKDRPAQKPDPKSMPASKPDKSQLKLPVRSSEVSSAKKQEDSASDVKDCDQAILDMRKAVKKVKHLYEQVADSRDPESRKMAESLSASLNDIQRTLAEMSTKSPDIASKTFKPITPTPEDDMMTNRSVTPVDTTAIQSILEHYSSHLSEKVFSLIQRRLDSSTPSSSSDA